MNIRHILKFKLIFLFAGAFAALSKPKRAEFLICLPHRNFMAQFLCILHKYGNPIKNYLTFLIEYAILKVPKGKEISK